MARTRLIMLTLAASLCAGTAIAQTDAVETKAVDAATDAVAEVTKEAPKAKFIRAQFVRPGDVSPEEYARLVKEADRIRAYQAAQNPAGSSVTYNAATQNQAQGYVQTQAQTYQQAPQQPAYQAVQPQPFAPAQTVTPPQSYADYMAANGHLKQIPVPVQVPAPAPQTVYYTQQQQPQQGIVQNYPSVPSAPRNAQAPKTIYAATQYGHSVVKGDTLYNISKRYGVTLQSLKQVNGLSGDVISVGQTLAIPGAVANQVPAGYQYQQQQPVYIQQQPTQPVYIQQQQQRNVQQPAYNPQTGYTQTVTTNASGTQFIRSVQAVPPTGVYAVLPKDTIYSIAKFACVRPDEVSRINGITNAATLQPGQKLTMPPGHCL